MFSHERSTPVQFRGLGLVFGVGGLGSEVGVEGLGVVSALDLHHLDN